MIDLHALRVRTRRLWRKLDLRVKRLAFGVVLAFAHALFFASGYGVELEPKILEYWFSLRGPVESSKKVILISINNGSYSALGASVLAPWPRPLMTELLRELAAQEPARVILDFFFVEQTSQEDDQSLAQAMKGVPLVIGRYEETTLLRLPDSAPQKRVTSYNPLGIFKENAKKVVTLQLNLETGKIRYLSRFHVKPHEQLPMLAALDDLLPADFHPPGLYDFINYYGPAGSISSVPIEDVLLRRSSLPADLFRGKIVLVGLEANTSALPVGKDSFYTPASPLPIYGVEIHATIASNLLESDWIRRISRERETIILTLLAIIAALFITARSLALASIGLCALVLCWAVLSFILFLEGFFLPGLCLMSTVCAFYIAGLFVRFVASLRTQLLVEKAMGIGQNCDRP